MRQGLDPECMHVLAGSLQQNETAQLMDQVCGLVGGCSFVLNTGDNLCAARQG